MKLKNIIIIAIVTITIIAGLTISITNFAKTAFVPLCNNNLLKICNFKTESYATKSSPQPSPQSPLITETISDLLTEKPKAGDKEEQIKNDLNDVEITKKIKSAEIVKTQQVVTTPIENAFKNNKGSKTISNTFYPTSQGYWDVFQGFDFSGKLKQIYNSENHEFTDNSIILRGKKELTQNPIYSTTVDNERFYTKTADYAGARLSLKDKFQYGHISFKAKIPNISGILPAVWLLNQDGNNFTEVDLLEVPGSQKNMVWGVSHYGPNYTSLTTDANKMYVPNMSTQFHQYDMYKTPEKIQVFIDGALLYEKNVSNAIKYNGINGLDQPMQLIINMNIGDAWGGVIDDSQLPVAMTIKDMMIEEYSY